MSTIDIKDIFKATLDFGVISTSVFQQLQTDSDTLFISKETKEAFEKYVLAEGKDRVLAKQLWKSLLIDAIYILKLNDNREKLYNDSKKILDDKNYAKFHENFTKIRNINTYGIDEISTYFDDFIEYESVLYGTGEYYRDHIHHVLSVWAIGISLTMSDKPIGIEFGEGFLPSDKDFNFQINNSDDNEKSELSISKSELWAMWSIIALCHDLGYPLEKTSHINQKVKKIVNHFGCLNFNELNFKFDLFNGYIIEKFLNIVASKTVRCDPKKGKDAEDSKEAEIHKTEVQQKYHYKISKSLEEYKHGMFSGLLVFKKLTYFLETDYSPDTNSLTNEDLRQFYIRKEILRAICGHTCPKIYHLKMCTPSFLLIICDELQTWGRPSFNDLLSGNAAKDKSVKLKQYKREGNETKIHIEFNYTKIDIDKKKEKDIELEKHLVKSNYEKIHYLLRSAKDDSVRNIYFKWDILFKNIKYQYIFDTKKDSYDMMSVSCKSREKESKEDFDFELFKRCNIEAHVY